jgi:hypothetical protein
VEQIMPWRGYRVVIDRDATFEEWRDAVLQRDAAGIIWRSHGNLSPSPYEPDDSHFMARVLSAGGSREKLFAGDWRALLPEGLGLLVLASCMTNGIYLPEDFKLIEDRRGAKLEDARISTFETEVGDRALHYRGYRGPSFSPGIGAEAWFTLRRFLPARISPGELGENPDLFPDDFPGAVEHGVVTIEWIPHLVDALAAADSGRQKKIQAALGALSLELGEEFQSGDPGAWREWWNRPGVQAAFSQHALVAESRPPGDLFWAGLWSAFETERDRRGGIPQDGPDCWQAWFHCIFDRHHLPESVSSLGDQIVWQLTIPSDSAEQYPCPLPRDLVVSYHPATGELSHNLAEIMDGLRVEDLECASLY